MKNMATTKFDENHNWRSMENPSHLQLCFHSIQGKYNKIKKKRGNKMLNKVIT